MASADAAVKGLDVRVTRIERLLPELATKKDLAAAIKPLGETTEELRKDVKELSQEMRSVRGEVAELREQMKSLPRAIFENFQERLKVVLDAVSANQKATDELREEMREGFRRIDRRMMKLEGRGRLEGAD